MLRCFPFLVIVLVLSAASGPAEAQRRGTRVDREARNLFQAGQHAFGDGNYERALDYFERAHALSQRSGFLYNIATTADRLRADERALEAYRAFLAAEPATERRAEVEARIAFMEERLRPPPEPEPEPQPASVEPPAEAMVVLVPAPAPVPEPSGGVHPAGVVTLVGAGLFFASFGVFGGLSLAENDALATSCGRDVGAMCAPSEVRDLQQFNTAADVSLIAGGVAAALGLVLLLALPPEREERAQALSFVPWISGDGAGSTWVGRW